MMARAEEIVYVMDFPGFFDVCHLFLRHFSRPKGPKGRSTYCKKVTIHYFIWFVISSDTNLRNDCTNEWFRM